MTLATLLLLGSDGFGRGPLGIASVLTLAAAACIARDAVGAHWPSDVLAGELLAGPVRRAALFARAYHEPAVQWHFHVPSFSVYRERETPARPPLPGELAIARADHLAADAPVEVLFRERGVLHVRRKPD